MCTVINCNKQNHGNGLCNKHYRRFYRKGTTNLIRPSTIERFNKFVNPPDKNDCHIWNGFHGHGGYGIFRINGKNVGTHRYSWEINFGNIPKGMWVLHKCDNPPCVNPEHLFLGTCIDNKRDEVEKGRNIKGEKHPASKLTEKQIIAIRNDFHSKKITRKKLAFQYNVSYPLIVKIISRECWKHI